MVLNDLQNDRDKLRQSLKDELLYLKPKITNEMKQILSLQWDVSLPTIDNYLSIKKAQSLIMLNHIVSFFKNQIKSQEHAGKSGN